jgi:KaiC/GvpD/RAD55 family RecA-like ATPase
MSEIKKLFKPIVEAIEDVSHEGPIPFIWGGIKEGSFGYVFGPSKSGKTTFCENLAIDLVCGIKEFLGNPILDKKYRVLFISLEEYKRPRSERNAKQVQFLKPPVELIINLLVIEDEFPKFIREDFEWKILSDTIAESKADIVFIDSLTRMGVGDFEKSDNARKISAKLKEISHDCGVTMIVIHHTPKLNGKGLLLDSLAGSHVFAQEADFIIGINKFNGIRYIKEVACRYKREDDEKVLTFDINDSMWIEPLGYIAENKLFENQDGRVDDTNLNTVRTLIRNSTEKSGSPTFKSKDILSVAEQNMDRSTFFEKLEDLRNVGEISRTGKGDYQFNNPTGT